MALSAAFPANIKTFSPRTDLIDDVDANDVNVLYTEVDAIEVALGINPQGAAVTVGARITALEESALFFNGVAQTVSTPFTYTGAQVFEQWTVPTPAPVSLSGSGSAQVGATASTNIIFDGSNIQARNGNSVATLNLNPIGGQVTMGSGVTVNGDGTVSGNLSVGGAFTVTGAVTGRSGTFAQGGLLGALAASTASVSVGGPLYVDGAPSATPGLYIDPAVLAFVGANPFYFRTNGQGLDLVAANPTNLAQTALLRVDESGNVQASGNGMPLGYLGGHNISSQSAPLTSSLVTFVSFTITVLSTQRRLKATITLLANGGVGCNNDLYYAKLIDSATGTVLCSARCMTTVSGGPGQSQMTAVNIIPPGTLSAGTHTINLECYTVPGSGSTSTTNVVFGTSSDPMYVFVEDCGM